MNKRQYGGISGDKRAGTGSEPDPSSTQSSLEHQDPKHETEPAQTGSAPSIASDLKDAAKTAGQSIKDQAWMFAAGVGEELGKTAEDQKARALNFSPSTRARHKDRRQGIGRRVSADSAIREKRRGQSGELVDQCQQSQR